MPVHSELTALAVVILAALLCGMIMTKLRQPAIVGYILAGVILGPSVFPVVEHKGQVAFLAELGVLMLLFFIGMELSLRGFRAIWKTALGAAMLQIGISLALMLVLAHLIGLPLPVAILFAFVIALSSTAVVVKMLEQMNILRSPVGQLTLGVLIAQDLAVVPMMLIIASFGTGEFGWLGVAKVCGSIALLACLIWYLSRRQRITLPFSHVVVGNVDLTPLSGLAYCFGAAALTGLLDLSPAFGAFLAGLVIGNSTGRAAMIRSTRPIQSVLLMIFFLSIGLLIDLKFIWDNIGTVLVLLLSVTVLKTIFNIGILHILREPWPHAFIAGVLLAQIGEFSFVLGTTAVAAGVISDAQNSLIVAVAAFSLLFSPIWQLAVRRLLRILLLSVTSFAETFRTMAGREGRRVEALFGRIRGAFGRSAKLAQSAATDPTGAVVALAEAPPAKAGETVLEMEPIAKTVRDPGGDADTPTGAPPADETGEPETAEPSEPRRAEAEEGAEIIEHPAKNGGAKRAGGSA